MTKHYIQCGGVGLNSHCHASGCIVIGQVLEWEVVVLEAECDCLETSSARCTSANLINYKSCLKQIDGIFNTGTNCEVFSHSAVNWCQTRSVCATCVVGSVRHVHCESIRDSSRGRYRSCKFYYGFYLQHIEGRRLERGTVQHHWRSGIGSCYQDGCFYGIAVVAVVEIRDGGDCTSAYSESDTGGYVAKDCLEIM